MRSLATAASIAVLLGAGALSAATPAASQDYEQASATADFPPPPLPVYDQPPPPGPGYIWTPGYWAWDDDYGDYYWIPGAWVLAPEVGWLWTPAWWGWDDGAYIFHSGYWGPRVGFYGGIDYGFGYNGAGYYGGEWRGDRFYYNRAVNNVRNLRGDFVYDRQVEHPHGRDRASFSGGAGGVRARPTPGQIAAMRDLHRGATPVQAQHFERARNQPDLRASFNHGAPPIAATARAGAFTGALPARNPGSYRRPEGSLGPGYGASARPGDGRYAPPSGYRAREPVDHGPGVNGPPSSGYRPPGETYGGRGPAYPQAPAYRRPGENYRRPSGEGAPVQGYGPPANAYRGAEGYHPPGAGYRPPTTPPPYGASNRAPAPMFRGAPPAPVRPAAPPAFRAPPPGAAAHPPPPPPRPAERPNADSHDHR